MSNVPSVQEFKDKIAAGDRTSRAAIKEVCRRVIFHEKTHLPPNVLELASQLLYSLIVEVENEQDAGRAHPGDERADG